MTQFFDGEQEISEQEFCKRMIRVARANKESLPRWSAARRRWARWERYYKQRVGSA